MAKPKKLSITEAVRKELESWLRSSNVRRSHAERARIVLLSTEGLSAASIADRLGCSRRTVYKWRERFVETGLEGLIWNDRLSRARCLISSPGLFCVCFAGMEGGSGGLFDDESR